MLAARFYERNDLCSTYMIFLSIPFFSRPALLLSFVPFLVSATPIQNNDSPFAKRDGSGASSQTMSPKIWIPIVVAVIILFCLSVMTWTKTSWRKALRFFSFSGATLVGAPVSSSSAAPRELTAEQLAGTINGTANQSGNASRPTRRTRRPRRTPSQMSVTSLPPYNKEPGEEELVIFRGRDVEDVTTMPTAVAVNSLDEERDESVISHDSSQPARYSPMPTSPHNMPLLHDDDTYGDLSLQSLSPSGEDMPRRDSDNSSHETSSLTRVDSSVPEISLDPRGEVPSYSDVVTQAESQQNLVDSANFEGQHMPLPSPSAEQRTNRRSGFRTLLNRMSIVGHSRSDSASSTFSSHIPQVRELSSRASNHRATPSGSGSLLTSSMFRTISRQRSNHTLNSTRLNSPSLISLNSISAPLTHTVTRTEFTYPKTGPTAEQLKVISSRESFARFGIPYGPDAIAFAASSSRQDLLPPPEFEVVVSETSHRPTTPGPSRLRSSSSGSNDRPNPENSGSLVTSVTSSNGSDNPRSPSPSAVDAPTLDEQSPSPMPKPTSLSPMKTISSSFTDHNVITVTGPSSKSLDLGTRLETPPVSVPSASVSFKPSVSEFGSLSVPPTSSHNDHPTSSTRSGSRASVLSYQSYATAAESLGSSTAIRSLDGGLSSDDHESEPPTPRLGVQHVLESTDATIIPDKRTMERASTVEVSTSGH